MDSNSKDKYRHAIMCCSLLKKYSKLIRGAFFDERNWDNRHYWAYGVRLEWDRRCRKDTVYIMTSNDTYDLYGKIKAMFGKIRKEKLDVR